MVEAEFDAIASQYEAQHARSIRLSGEDAGYFARYKIEDMRKIADRRKLTVNRIMDFGAGIGNSLKPLRTQFPEAHITCLDVSARSLDLCRKELSQRVDFHSYDGEHVPDELGNYDLIFTACVFHHIPAESHISLLSQIRQRLARDGLFILFEHNPWNPLTVHAVNTCPFDENAVLISASEMRRRMLAAGFAQIKTNFRIFFPGPLRALRALEPALVRVPFGAQYSLTANS